MRVRSTLVLAVAAATSLAACSLLVDTSGLHDGAADGDAADGAPDSATVDDGPSDTTSDDGGTDAPVAVDANAPCPSGRGPTMVRIVATNGSFCIDTTEVTNAHWVAFLAEKETDTSGQAPMCTWNTSFVPKNTPNPNLVVWPVAASRSAEPIANVDWCDARAYCAWAGKRLCGRIGGGPAAFTDPGNATTGEWMNACSAGGVRVFPYGATYKPVCNDGNHGVDAAIATGSLPDCRGGNDAVFDMSGNVEEWEDACDGTSAPIDTCQRRGGSFTDGNGGVSFRCDTPFKPAQTRNRGDIDVGVRCCAD
ncbi:MAG: pyoverdine responsive serine/threonine kinase [Labilithrix sp.]|jgi:formylglycine-generating enzyme required for sulfatase activity|nr:pyoverdine responsive serine/threonine kinase [Labilithrix sp.]